MATFVFRNEEEAARVDLTRIGAVNATSVDGLTVDVEVDFSEWADESELDAIVSGMNACGAWPEVA